MGTTWSGIDVSEWQGVIDWNKVKAAGMQFGLLRIGYGDTLSYPNQIDKQFKSNYQKCKAAGMPIGGYYYCYAETEDQARREAQSCLALIKGLQFEYPIYYDVEELDTFRTGKTNQIIKAFNSELEKADWWAGVYIYRSAAQSYLTSDVSSRYAMAIAEYGPKLNYSGPYGIWQNTSTMQVNGISSRVDHDWCYIDYPTQIKSRGKNGYSKPSTDKRIETTQDCDILVGTATAPPVAACVGKGNQYTIDKTVKVGAYTFGHIKGTDNRWINLKGTKYI